MIMLKISLVFIIFFINTAFSYEITDRLEIYVNEEMFTKDDSFKSELKRCFKVAEKHSNKPNFEEYLKKENCYDVFQEYEKVVEKATERYKEEIDKDYEILLKRYREKLIAYREDNLHIDSKNFIFNNDRYKFLFIKKPVDVKDIWVEVKGDKLPFCTTENGILFFHHVKNKGNQEYSIFIQEDDGTVVEIRYKGKGEFKRFKINQSKDEVVLPFYVYRGYIIYDDLKKELPKINSYQNPCSVDRFYIQKQPKEILIELPHKIDGQVGIKTYKVLK